MSKWSIKPACSSTWSIRTFKLHLVVCDFKGLPFAGLQTTENSNLQVQIEWRGPKRLRNYLTRRVVERNCTSKQSICSDGSVNWNEGFDHDCKFKLMDSKHFKSWLINLEVQGLGLESKRSASVLAKVTVDISKIACPTESSEVAVKIPVNCSVGGSTIEAGLTVMLKFVEFQTKGNNGLVHPLSQSLLLPSLSSCIRLQHQTHSDRFQNPDDHPKVNGIRGCKFSPNQSTDLCISDSSSEEETEFTYGHLATTNLILINLLNGKPENSKIENWDKLKSSNWHVTPQPSLVRLVSWNKRKLNFGALSHPRDTPLLNKAYGEDGGDDIDNDRRFQLIPSQPREVQDDNDFQPSGFADSDRFEIGAWEERKLISRDGQLEIMTNVFLASIDQRSEKAAGGSACTVLAAVIASWLHQNPKTLPLRCQFDKLVREGSSEWRHLCEKKTHRERFSDQHFDLDTVLQAKEWPVSVIPEKSYVGFFVLDNMADHLKFLQGAMSFDSIWEELQSTETSSEEQIYIVSWNDHFFVLMVEADAIYIIDTLGERLFEGCNKAYILKFNKESKVYRVQPDMNNQKVERKGNLENNSSNSGSDEEERSSQDIICEGKASCKEFIKGFLAALPLRELQANIEKGLMGEAPLHHHLQIEFHYTALRNESPQLMQNKS